MGKILGKAAHAFRVKRPGRVWRTVGRLWMSDGTFPSPPDNGRQVGRDAAVIFPQQPRVLHILSGVFHSLTGGYPQIAPRDGPSTGTIVTQSRTGVLLGGGRVRASYGRSWGSG